MVYVYICVFLCVSKDVYVYHMYVCIYTYSHALADNTIQRKLSESQKIYIQYCSEAEGLLKEALIFVCVLICLYIFSVPCSRTLL